MKEETAAKKAAAAKSQLDQERADQLQQEQAEAFDRAHKLDAKSAWMATGGTAAEFEKRWLELPEMIRQEVIQGEITTRHAVALLLLAAGSIALNCYSAPVRAWQIG